MLASFIKYLRPLVYLFYSGTEWDAITILTLVFRILMVISIGAFVVSLIGYLVRYRIFEALFSKLSGNAREYDHIKRAQMRAELEDRQNAFAKEKKSSFITKLYRTISQTGITEIVPGFSEFGFLITLVTFSVAIFVCTTVSKGIVVGAFATGGFLLIAWYSLSLLAYNRKMKLEQQLLQFANACASASMQYSNIIDIFGAIYEQFSSPLREGLESCYVEAKQTNNKELAMKHLKEKYDSTQFAFVIDNLELCSSNTGDYYSVAKDISDTVSIYSASHEKKRALLRNAKLNLSAMFVVCIGILYALSMFLENLQEVLLNTTIGNIAIISLILLYFYGLNMKSEK